VVTEIATPTPALATRLGREHSGHAGEECDDDRLVAHVRQAPQDRVIDVEAGGQDVELVLQQREQRGEEAGHGEPRDERQQRPAGRACRRGRPRRRRSP
jgi:hypothetical protein